MGEEKKRLPVGLENFEQIINDNYYYVDKTGLISELIRNGGMVNLFTRPRRFGKTLNMSMLEHFFSIERDQSIYDGLEISKDTKLCEEYMGKYPVISISLKGINAATYEDAFDFAVRIMKKVARNVQFLLGSDALSDYDKLEYKELLNNNMSEAAFCGGLKILSELLEKHYGTKVVLLIDEYDVPLAKAFENGYYDQMIFLIRSLLEQALKTNDSLKFAVMTGCMRISKESIFTGLNNLKVLSITDERYDEYFGFTDDEVRDMLHYYELDSDYETVKNWYDGYRFGKADVYCPWDVINYCSDHIEDPYLPPQNYWLNTSGNEMIYHFIDGLEDQMGVTKEELELLVNGGSVQKNINQELTYKELYSSIDNLWSTLFMTGYLTSRSNTDGNRYDLVIPNREIRNIITEHILKLFKENIKQDGQKVNAFCDALLTEKADVAEKLFSDYMQKTISVRDTFVQKPTKENFYHGVLLGLLSHMENWAVWSNIESGEGYCDILLEVPENRVGVVIEMKYAQEDRMEAACTEALKQIEQRQYAARLKSDGMKNIVNYGIACYRKHCKVKIGKENS